MARELFVTCFPHADTAEQVLATARRLEAAHLLRVEDCVTVRRADDGTLAMQRTGHRKLRDTALGAVLGAVLGKALGVPLLGAGVGLVGGALTDRLPDTGIDAGFVHDLAQRLGPNSSAIFVLVRRARVDRVLSAPDKVLPEIGRFGGTVLHTTLTAEDDERLQAVLDETYRKAVALETTRLTPRHAPRRRIVKGTRSSPASRENKRG